CCPAGTGEGRGGAPPARPTAPILLLRARVEAGGDWQAAPRARSDRLAPARENTRIARGIRPRLAQARPWHGRPDGGRMSGGGHGRYWLDGRQRTDRYRAKDDAQAR